MAHVFITHINEHAELALAIKMFLGATIEPPLDFMMIRKPLDVFVSSEPGRILPGEDWLPRLKQELKLAKVVISLLTNGSLSRPWVNLETGAAWITDKKILPVWCEERLFKNNLPKPYVDWQIVHLPKGADELRKAVEQYVGAPSESSPSGMAPNKDLNILQAAFERFHKTEADNAVVIKTETPQSPHLQQDRRAQIDKWREMVREVALKLDEIQRGESPPITGVRSPVAYLLERHPDFSSLRSLLPKIALAEIHVGMTFIAGPTIDSKLIRLYDEIDDIEKEWGLR